MEDVFPHKSLPMVSIGLPTYNRPIGLQKALEWISRQTYQNIEVIISDNCSEIDEVQTITTEFAKKDQRIKVFRQEKNIGLENNFNFVYAQSKAPYFVWMSDDDFFESDYIEKCVTFLEQNPDYILCSGIAKYYDGETYMFSEPMFKVDQTSIASRLYTYFKLVHKNGNFYGVFRNQKLSIPPLPNHIGSDWAFMAKLSICGKLSYLDTTAYHRSIAGNSQTRKKMTEKAGVKNLKKLFFETYIAYNISTNIFTDPNIKKKVSCLNSRVLTAMIFFQINCKLFFKFIRKVTHLKTEYS